MSSEPPRLSEAPAEAPTADAGAAQAHGRAAVPRGLLWLPGLLAGAALLSSALLWEKLITIQEQLARQSADSGTRAMEALASAKQAQDLARDTAARQAVMDTRLGEVALQRSQLEDLIQSLTRSRDENLVVDIESAVRLAQQQAQLTGSVEPLLAALRTADQRLVRAAQPRLARLRAAIGRDIDRIKAAGVTDVSGLLARLDELVRQIDDLPLANAAAGSGAPLQLSRKAQEPPPHWWQRLLAQVRDEARNLVRVSRIDQPEAVLLAPEQAVFLRENVKLKLLNARLGLLARQTESARADVAAAAAAVHKYFDPASRRTQQAATQLQQVQAQIRAVEMPRIDETLAALATASAGR